MAPLLLARRADYLPPSVEVRREMMGSPTMLGAVEIGIFVSMFLFGVIMTEGHSYFRQYGKKDPRALKALIWFLLALEFGHSLTSMSAVYYFTIATSDEPIKPGNCYELTLTIVHSVLITAIVQGFYVDRCRRFVGASSPITKVLIGVIGGFLVTTALAFGLWISYESWLSSGKNAGVWDLQIKWGWLMSLRLSLSAFNDVLIAACMCFGLKRSERSLGDIKMKSTKRLLNGLAIWTVETGLTTSIASVVVVVCFQTMKFNYIWVGVWLSVAKIYSISLLASLNARSRYRLKYAGPQTATSSDTSQLMFRRVETSSSRRSSRRLTISSAIARSAKTPSRRFTVNA
ncbi:hypothetical protein VNI00_006203 [Paramarasmius palmivorus]|uniref:DUF6534 domain-containing protein n=1 Tax=Paramarasmius palmivorus TaxID=297713 RepID=A0AAW0D985_9AGAR